MEDGKCPHNLIQSTIIILNSQKENSDALTTHKKLKSLARWVSALRTHNQNENELNPQFHLSSTSPMENGSGVHVPLMKLAQPLTVYRRSSPAVRGRAMTINTHTYRKLKLERTVQLTELFPSRRSQSPEYILALYACRVDSSSTTAVTTDMAIDGWSVHR